MESHDRWTILRFEAVDSTQAVAADLIGRGASHHTVVVAERQTAGYGRNRGMWHDAPGASLLMTIIVRPVYQILPHTYAMIAALACVEAIHTVGGLSAQTKWPNDVQVNGAKVAGILGDATWRGDRLEALRIGIGLNIAGARADFRARGLPHATSLGEESGRLIDREEVRMALLSVFERLEGEAGAGGYPVMKRWRDSLETIGRSIVATAHDGSLTHGTAVDIDDEGDLVVISESGARLVLHPAHVRTLRYAIGVRDGVSRP